MYIKSRPSITTTTTQGNKMYKYKLQENCTFHSLAGLKCWTLSKYVENVNFFFFHSSRVVDFCFVRYEMLAMLVSDKKEKKNKAVKPTMYSRIRGDYKLCKSPTSSI